LEIKARIKGFSNRIPSIMVPEEFLLWANERYGTEIEPAPCRLLTELTDGADPALSTFLRVKNDKFSGLAEFRWRVLFFRGTGPTIKTTLDSSITLV